MRFTKRFCAIVSLLTCVVSTRVLAQAPPTEDQLRESLRKALDNPQATPNPPPAPPVTTPIATPRATPVVPTMATPATSYSTFNLPRGTATNLSLTLRDAIQLALQYNLELQVLRYNPVISEYNRRALYGVYDPVFSSSINHSDITRPAGGLNLNTGNTQPGTESQSDSATAGLAGYLPSGMTYNFTHNIGENQVRTPFQIGTNSFGQPVFGVRRSDVWNTVAGVTLTQPLLRDLWIDSDRLQIKLARRNVRRSELLFERQIMDIINRVEQAYYNVVAAREAVRVSEGDLEVKKKFHDEQLQRVKVGSLTELDAKLAQAEQAKSESILIGLRGAAVDAESTLKGLIFDNYLSQLDVHIDVTDRMVALPATLDMMDAFREATEKRPDLQDLRIALEQAQIRLKYTHNQLFPRLDVVGTLGYSGLDTTTGGALDNIAKQRYQQSSIGLQLSLPLSLWRERNLHKSARVAKEQAILNLKWQEDLVVEQVETEIRLIRTLWAQIPFTREVVAAQQQALDAEKKKEQVGKSTSFNVLTIASDLLTAQVNEIRAILIYNQALSELAFRKGTTLERWQIDRPVRSNQ